jgi:uncharacterized protein YndB with AHSA1/START domain
MTDVRTSPSSADERRRWVRMRRRLEAPPDRVFRAWADPEELQRWLPERVEGSLTVGTRSVLVWLDERVWWDVVQAQPGRVFAFSRPWSADESMITKVRLRFEPAGYGSRVELEDGPFLLDEPGGLDAWSKAVEWWAEALTMLRAYLDFSVDVRQGP